MALIPFPNIPNVPGVPAIPRSPNFPPNTTLVLGFLQSLIWRAFQIDVRWGIYDSSGNPLGNPNQFTGFVGSILSAAGLNSTLSTSSVDYSKEMRVSDFPVETGSFASYNKVETPASPVVTLCLAANENDRRMFLDAIDTACKSTDLYSVVTPEVTYIDYSIERYNYSRRSSKGATLLMVEITLKEIRQVSAIFTQSANNTQIDQPKNADASPQLDTGKVQPKAVDQSTLKKLVQNFPSLQ
jgi:hypothetical protein